MGIEVYLDWPGGCLSIKQLMRLTPEPISNAQQMQDLISTREKFTGQLYATEYLFKEAYEKDGKTYIPSAVLRARLDHSLEISDLRLRMRGDDPSFIEWYRNYLSKMVEKAEKLDSDGIRYSIRVG